MQLPITRPGRGAKSWGKVIGKAAMKCGSPLSPPAKTAPLLGRSPSLVTPHLHHCPSSPPAASVANVAKEATNKSDENLEEVLVRVGTYFGRNPNQWDRDGEPTQEVVQEGGKKLVKRMQKFSGWKLALQLKLPLYDQRLQPIEGRPDLDFTHENLDMDQATWAQVIADQPWTSQEARKRVCRLLEAKMLSQDAELHLEGLHGMWEMVVNKEHHEELSDTQVEALLNATMHFDVQCAAVATAAIWTMASAQRSRRVLLERGVLEKLMEVARRCIKAEEAGDLMPSPHKLSTMQSIVTGRDLSRPATAGAPTRASARSAGRTGDPEEGPADAPPADEGSGGAGAGGSQAELEDEPSQENVWAQYQESLLGALGVFFVDREARVKYLELDPDLSVLIRMCVGDPEPGSPAWPWVAHRKSLAARAVCMLAHRDPQIRLYIVQHKETFLQLLELMSMDAASAGAIHVKLCMITVAAIMVLDDPCMEAIRKAGWSNEFYQAGIKVLIDVLEMMTPGSPTFRLVSDLRVCLAMAEGLSQAVWGAAYECCLPGGGGLAENDVSRLAGVSFQCLRLQKGNGLSLGRVIRCLVCTLANMAANEELAGVIMRPRPKTPPPVVEHETTEEEDDYYGYKEEKKEKVVVVEEEVPNLEPDPDGAGAFLLELFDSLDFFDAEDEDDVRTSICTTFALLSGHSFQAVGEECMWGPYRESLLFMGTYDKILDSLTKPIGDPIMRELCEIASSYALMQLSTMVGELPAQALQLFVQIMHEKKSNVELVEYMMAGMWILLRTDHNRAIMLSSTDGNAPDVVKEIRGGEDGGQGEEKSAEQQEEEATLAQAEQALRSAEASFMSGEPHAPATEPSVQSTRPKGEGSGTIAAGERRGSDPEGAGEGDTMDLAMGMGAKLAAGGAGATGSGEWGLSIILDVGFTWVKKLGSLGSGDGDAHEDTPLVKLFEFLVSGLGLLLTDATSAPRTADQDIYEVVEYPRSRPLFRDPRGTRTLRQQQEDAEAKTSVGFLGMTLHPPEEDQELTESFGQALELLVELLGLKDEVTAKILQLSINTIWSVVLSNQFAEAHVLALDCTPRLLAIARNAHLPPKVRDSAAGLLSELIEFHPNLDMMGGVLPSLRTFVHLVNSGIPLLQHRGALCLGRAAYKAPALCPNPGAFQTKVRRRIARVGGVRALVSLVQVTHQRYSALISNGGPGEHVTDLAEANAKQMQAMFSRIQQQLKSIAKARKKGGEVSGSNYADRDMTMIKALAEKRNAGVADLASKGGLLSDEDLMDDYESIVDVQTLALKALLNISTYPKNQVRIAKAGLMTLLGIQTFFSQMMSSTKDFKEGPEDEILVLSSKVLQNIALHPRNRTLLYQAELRGSLRKVEIMAEPNVASKGLIPIWGEGREAMEKAATKYEKKRFKKIAERTDQSTRLATEAEAGSLGLSLRAMQPAGAIRGKTAQDCIPLGKLERPKVMFPPIEPRSSGSSSPRPATAAEGLAAAATAKKKDVTSKAKFAEWAASTFPIESQQGMFGADLGGPDVDSSDSDDELGSLEAERLMRIQLPALNQSLRKPVAHMWELPPEHPLRHGKSRWNPRVSEYVQRQERGRLQVVANDLLTHKDPNAGAQMLMAASLELSSTGRLPEGDLGDAVVSERPGTPERNNGRVPLTRFTAGANLETALSISQKLKENRRAKNELKSLEDVQLNVQMHPKGERTLIQFDAGLKDSRAPVGARPRLTVFKHEPGALVYREIMEPYTMPCGKEAFFYYDSGQTLDEVPVRLGKRPPRPHSFPSALQRHMPLAALLDVISKPPGSGVDIALLKPMPKVARLPKLHTLPTRDTQAVEAWAFGDLDEINLHFVMSAERTSRMDTDTTVHDIEQERPKTPWRLPDSIFRPRRTECDSKAFFDNHMVEDKNFDKNWKRMAAKDKFSTFLKRETKANKDKDPKIVEKEIQQLLRKNYSVLLSTFTYFALISGGQPFTMELNDFTSFLEACNIPDKDSESCKKSDCDRAFIECNFIENKNSAEAKVATEHSMLKHEFMEALIRISVNKYGRGQPTTDIALALEMLLEENILPNLPPAARMEPNEFRRVRLYQEEVDTIYKRHKKELISLYSRYRLPPRGGGLRPKVWKLYCWEAFVKDTELVKDRDDCLSNPMAAQAFGTARMMVNDEIAQWAKYETLTFIDFLDALGRVADMLSWPSMADVKAMGFEDALQWRLAVEAGEHPLQRRASFGVATPKERPLHVKIETVLDYVFRRLMYVPGEAPEPFTLDLFLKRMKKIDAALGA